MMRYVSTLWSSFFPCDPHYPLQVAGFPHQPIESNEQLSVFLKQTFVFFTYRRQFEGIATATRMLHSDQGWGCLLRTTQMLLAHFLRMYAPPADHKLSFFFDKTGEDAPFSIHNMIQSVWSTTTFRPEYWSPSQGCEALRRVVRSAVKTGVLQTNIGVVVSSSGCLFAEDVLSALRASSVVLILTPVRVSVAAELTQEAYLQLEALLQLPECLGMVGGIPGKSYYFFGHSQTQLMYLDPHQYIQPALLSEDPNLTGVVEPSMADVRCVHWSRVDTSLFLAFVVRSKAEWLRLRPRLPTRFLHVEDKRAPSDYELLRQHQQGTHLYMSPLKPSRTRLERTSRGRAGASSAARAAGPGEHQSSSPQGGQRPRKGRDNANDSDSDSWDMMSDL